MARITGSRITRSQSRQASSELSNQIGRSGALGSKHLNELPEEQSPPPGGDGSTQVIPESPENHEGYTNVSGTTLAPNDADAVEYQLGTKITNHLPFIQEQATLVMNLLVPQNLNPESIPVEARKLRDAGHPNTKRLDRSTKGLTDELQDSPLSSDGKPFLDTTRLRGLIPPAQFDASISDVHMTNCAMLALVMFSRNGEDSQPQVIQDLDEMFPMLLMEKISTTPKSRAIGASHTQEETFMLALNIRTQFFIMELERRQRESDFNPVAILRQIFCMDITPSDASLDEDPSSFRGFHLPHVFEDSDGHLPDNLPEKLLIAVSDRFNDLHEEVSDWDEVDVDGLKKAYRWRAFERELARWIHVRSREIREDIRRISDKANDRSSSVRRFTPALATTPIPRQTPKAAHLQATPSSQKSRHTSMSHGVDETPEGDSHVSVASPLLAPSPQKAPVAETRVSVTSPAVAASTQQVPAPASNDQAKKPAQNDPARRQSKSNYRDSVSFARLKRRMEGSHQQSNSGATSRPQAHTNDENTLINTASEGTSAIGPALRVPSETHELHEYSADMGGEDDFTYVNHDEDDDDLDYAGPGDVLASTSPSASARINRVSHNPHQSLNPKDRRDAQRLLEENPASSSESITARRLFIDKQNDPRRVSPIDDNDTESPNQRHAIPSHANNRKRQISQAPSDDSDDFEQDTRDLSRRPEKRQRFLLARDEERSRQDGVSFLNSLGPASQDQPNPSQVPSTQPQRRSSELTDGETTTVRQLPFTVQPGRSAAEAEHWATLNTEAHSENIGRKPNQRWTKAEDERFIGLMATFGLRYAVIKKEDNAFPPDAGGPRLANRNQVQLKDRARTLKRKYIREGKQVPEYLAAINA
ncbi:hypothetical protein N7541_004906 [Penicillium brevicompactum]|uniref:Myb-like domain-containing protein n=1 Tax=Penicillium brevicompactum TaxID=5074 RepID=A0A9W9RHR1_PENBR|nr:hypothetical protein N7541_004906 [Penicillium brevicompactum]